MTKQNTDRELLLREADNARIRRVEPFWVPLDDGTRLSARLWLPGHAAARPVGVVLEYLPYRTRDLTRSLDDETGDRLSAGGFAFIRVDIRGTGESAGVAGDEFEESQTDDLVEIIEWLARQPWCNGSVGVRGYSWGGNVGLYAAARNPAPLKAVVVCCACGDRFARDLHWHGGSLGLTNVQWAAALRTVLGMPPDPAVVGERWRDMWRERLAAVDAVGALWVTHQRADDYWATSSPGAAYGAIDCPIYFVGGQLDGWVDEADSVLRNTGGPCKAIIGPWGHSFPQHGVPGPRMDWLAEELRWWRHWLAGDESELMREPVLRVYVQDGAAAQSGLGSDAPGHWASVDSWPSAGAGLTYHFDVDRLVPETADPVRLPVPDKGVVGLRWPEWGAPDKGAAHVAGDQSDDDEKSLTFDSEPLGNDVVFIGRPRVRLRVSADQPVAMLGVRLTEVTADGRSWPVSFGVLNLTHRDGSERPAPLVPGEFYDVGLDLRFVARRIRTGSRIRVAVSSTFWPVAALPPHRVALTLETGPTSSLSLTLLDNVPPAQAATAPALRTDAAPDWTAVPEPRAADSRVALVTETAYTEEPIDGVDVVAGYADRCVAETDSVHPTRARWQTQVTRTLNRHTTRVEVSATCAVTFDAEQYLVEEVLRATENGENFYEHRSVAEIPRELT
ncbi:CocE/NonD family hydrolase [Streptomyces sp. NPDC007901]|uniref:CocE/NonD family hydrolase n=1 Tax=Streptomyces sp. NPDC007901 TaxID=3364785 RepID=UPI0036E17C1E